MYYENDYKVIWELEESPLACSLPKLTLQPLLKMLCSMGFLNAKSKTGGVVRIQSRLENGQLILTVTDNGPGMAEPIDWSKGYGLGNVRKRLDLYFNNRYELLFENAPEGGAKVTVKVFAQVQKTETHQS